MTKKNTVVFILPVTSQPRYLKRIEAFSEHGFEYKIFSFERKYFKGEINKKYTSLGKMQHGSYVKRVLVLTRAIRKLIRNKDTLKTAEVIYVFGLDNLLLIKIALKLLRTKKPIIYEVSDIRKIMLGQGLTSKILRNIEKWLIKKVSFVIVTSPYFISDYYVPFLKINKNRFFTIENKLGTNIPNPVIENKESKKIRIGYFGVLRCQKSWDLAYELAKKHPKDVEVYIRGYLMNLSNFQNRVDELENIYYGGEYKSPSDLADMYNNIDVSLIGNVSKNLGNSKIALPNRFYESLHFHVPMITHKDTAVARKVNSLNVGWEMDFNDLHNSIEKLILLSRDEINMKVNNTYVDINETVGEGDHRKLIYKIQDYLQ